MDRLTIRNKYGDINPPYQLTSQDEEDDWNSDCRKKLAYYEDLEESGLLIKLPYPVGTPLFIPCRKQGVKQDHIRRWQTNNKGLMFCSNGSFYLADAIGKSIFLTREEADNKLKEMELNEHNTTTIIQD